MQGAREGHDGGGCRFCSRRAAAVRKPGLPSGTVRRSATANSSTTVASGRTLPIPTFALPSKSGVSARYGRSSSSISTRLADRLELPKVGNSW